MKRLAFSLVTVLFSGSVIVAGATGAFFSDTETSLGNTFTAGAIDLKIDNSSYYNGVANAGTSWTETDLTNQKFFDFADLKPNDYGEDTISLHVDTNDAYLCADVTLTSNDDNGINEPEGVDGDVTDGPAMGELAALVNFVWWADDGDNVLETGENVISQGPIGALALNSPFKFALADSDENIWTGIGGPVTGNTTYYIGKAWCFGTIGASPDDQDGMGNAKSPAGDNNANATAGEPEDGGISCDGSLLDNKSQTDSLTANVSFDAVQARHNSAFQCEDTLIFQTCTNPAFAYADSVVSSDIGVRKNSTAVVPDRSDPSDALGAPQSTGTPFDSPVIAGSFFSLGFDEGTDLTPTEGGWIVLGFADNYIVDGPGNDIRAWEVTGGTSYPTEKIKIEASQDGIAWVTLTSSADRDTEADLASGGLAWAKYVRITDVSVRAEFEDIADAYDLDAVSALNCGELDI